MRIEARLVDKVSDIVSKNYPALCSRPEQLKIIMCIKRQPWLGRARDFMAAFDQGIEQSLLRCIRIQV